MKPIKTSPLRNLKRLGVLALAIATAWIVAGNEHAWAEKQRMLLLARLTDYGEAYLEIGRGALERGQYLRAARVLSTAIRKGAQAEAFKLRARAYDLMGKRRDAISDLNQYISKQPSDPDGFILRGACHNLDHHHEAALSDFQRAVRLSPSFPDGYFGRGVAHAALENYQSAIRDFRKVLQIDPDNKDALFNLGVAYMLAEMYVDAIRTMRKTLEKESDTKWKQRLEAWVEKLKDNVGRTGSRPGHASFGNSVKAGRGRARKAAPGTSSGVGSADRGGSGLRRILGEDTERSRGGQADMSGSLTKVARGRTARRLNDTGSKSLTGVWETTYLGAKIRLEAHDSGDGNNFDAILRVRYPTGRVDTFRSRGTSDRGNIRMTHSGGHVFQGRLAPGGDLTGTLRLKSGVKVRVRMSRR